MQNQRTGLTFSELCKAIQVEPDAIEQMSLNLQKKALVFILKNRKHLNNRLDKIYLHQPIEEICSFISEDEFQAQAQALLVACTGPAPKTAVEIPKKFALVLQTIFDAGGIAVLCPDYRILTD